MATTNIFTFGGNVGVGTNNTTYKFEVYSGTSNLEDLEVDDLTVSDATDSTTTTNGAMKVAGGLGVNKNFHTLNTYVSSKLGVGKTAVANFDVNGTISATNLKIGSIVNAFVPQGLIAMWSGLDANIPNGWALCDGTNALPDLRARFIIGAGNSYAVGGTGGNTQVTLTEANLPGHTHSGDTGTRAQHQHTVDTDSDGTHQHTDTTGNYDHSHSVSTPNHTHAHQANSSEHQHNHAHQESAHAHTNQCGTYGNFNGICRHGGTPAGNGGGWINSANTGVSTQGNGQHSHTFNTADNGQHEHGYTTASYSAQHSHEFTTGTEPQHTHGSNTSSQAGQHTHSISTQSAGQGQAFEILPVYYALAFIRKT